MEEWKTYKLGSLCKKVCSGGTPKSTCDEYYGGGIPWLNTKEVDFNRIYTTESTISQAGLDNSSAKWIEKNAVIVAMYGNTAGKVALSMIPLTTNQACCNLMIDDNKADYRYIYYYLCSQYVQIKSKANGAAQQNLNAQQIKDLDILVPSLEVQSRIADILYSIDDKIELNNRINHNLEEQLSAKYEDLLRRSSKREPISAFAQKISDGVHNTVNDSCDGNFYLLSCKNLKDGRIVLSNNERKISSETFHVLRKRTQLEAWDILLSSVGTIGELVLLKEDPVLFEFQRSVAIIKTSDNEKACILFSALNRQKNELIHAAHGAVQQCLFLSDIKGFELELPDDISATKNFSQFAILTHKLIAKNEKENLELESIRNYLLPKLLSGELNSNEIDC